MRSFSSKKPQVAVPHWARLLAANRDFCNNIVLLFAAGEETQAFKFVFATRNPAQVHCMCLEVGQSTFPLATSAHDEEACLSWSSRSYRPLLEELRTSDEMPDAEPREVLPMVSLDMDNLFVSSSPLMSWAAFVQGLPNKVRGKHHKSKKSSSSSTSSDEEQRLSKAWEQHSQALEHLIAPPASVIDDDHDTSSNTDDSDFDASVGLDVLTAKRAEWVGELADGDGFKLSLLGGKWLLQHHGRQYDAFKAEARTTAAKEFCKVYNLQQSCRFDLLAYGEADAYTLAEEWRKKMSYFLEVYVSSGEAKHHFSEDELSGFAESSDFVNLADRLSGKKLERATYIRNMAPVLSFAAGSGH